MQKKLGKIVAVVIVAVYSILIGAGAYLQYSASEMFKDITEGQKSASVAEDNAAKQAKMAERLKKSDSSEVLKKISRIFLLLATIAISVAAIANKILLKNYLMAVGGSVLIGALATLPWCIMSGDGAANYYFEQGVIYAICAIFAMAVYGVKSIKNRQA